MQRYMFGFRLPDPKPRQIPLRLIKPWQAWFIRIYFWDSVRCWLRGDTGRPLHGLFAQASQADQ